MNKDLEKFINGDWKAERKCTAWINLFCCFFVYLFFVSMK